MKRGWVYGGTMVAVIVVSFLWVAEAQNPPASSEVPFKPAAPVESLMVAQEQHFNQIKDLIANKDAPERFGNMEHQANILAELGNVNYYHKKVKDYQEMAFQLRDQSKELAAAAKKQDEAGAKVLFGKINDTCNKCHDAHKDEDE